ncbi:hypothetical protein HMPREF9622_02034 [Cutibacterium modestum HL037PA3]|nr:hypothetical protein HMPREF9622_02034 [Cutibacterium modestum HL037PA3]
MARRVLGFVGFVRSFVVAHDAFHGSRRVSTKSRYPHALGDVKNQDGH